MCTTHSGAVASLLATRRLFGEFPRRGFICVRRQNEVVYVDVQSEPLIDEYHMLSFLLAKFCPNL